MTKQPFGNPEQFKEAEMRQNYTDNGILLTFWKNMKSSIRKNMEAQHDQV